MTSTWAILTSILLKKDVQMDPRSLQNDPYKQEKKMNKEEENAEGTVAE